MVFVSGLSFLMLEIGITYGPSKREIVNYRNSLLESHATAGDAAPVTPKTPDPEADQHAEMMAQDLDVVMQDSPKPVAHDKDDSNDASVDESIFIVGE